MPVELPELVITSKTQPASVIRQLMKDQGYEDADFAVDSTSDQPSEPEVPAAEPAAEPEVPAAAEPQVPAAGQEAGDEDDDDEEEAPPPAAAAPAQPPAKPKSGSAKLKEKLSAKEQENATLKAELDRLRTQAPVPAAAAPAPAPAAAPPEPEPELRAKPKFEDFADSEDQLDAFTTANGEWLLDKREFERDKVKRAEEKRTAPQREAEAAAQAEQQRVSEQFVQRATAVRQEHPTFDQEIVASKPTPTVVSVVTRQKDGPTLALWLARNPDELEAVNALTILSPTATQAEKNDAVADVIAEMGRIRYLISQQGMTERPTNREVPPPAPPATPPANTQPPAPAAAAPPATPPVTPAPAAGAPTRVKPQPVIPVGSRGATTQKTLAQIGPEELRNMNPDEYRRRIEKGERPR